MQRLASLASDRLRELKYRYDHRNDPPIVIVPPLNEDLSDLTEPQIANEIRAVTERLELGHTEPEGRDGLNYRLSRLRAQEIVAKKKGEHERPRQDTK